MARVPFEVSALSLGPDGGDWELLWHIKRKLAEIQRVLYGIGGERGIRTPGGVTLNGFQDRRNRPLCHLSLLVVCVCKGSGFLVTMQIFQDKTSDFFCGLA